MKRIALILAFLLGVLPATAVHAGEGPRLVSLLPSVTEILFALDLGENVVGVTSYCRYPPEAQAKRHVGGISDTNFELVYRLAPDWVILSVDAKDRKDRIEKMGLKTLEVETKSVEGILASIRKIGAALGRGPQAEALASRMERRIRRVRNKTKGLSRPSVLLTFLRPAGEGQIRDVYIAGNNSYFNDLIKIAGGENVYSGPKLITSPVVSAEGIYRMDPDVIIEVMSREEISRYHTEAARKDWDMMPELKALQQGRIYILNEPYFGIPGPRIVDALDELAKRIHPEVDWGTR